jgi:regulator of protease activity HflC (stomatin/prohibitin superfamily)
MAHEHAHEHEQDEEPEQAVVTPPDPAERSLSEALRISFIVLKIIMVVLVVAFLASGFKTVSPGERALVLRFGAILAMGPEGNPVLEPGAHWVFPYPIDELVKFPVDQPVSLAVDTFWHSQTRDDILGSSTSSQRPPPEKLNPLTEGYCLTRSERRSTEPTGLSSQPAGGEPNAVSRRAAALESEGSDYNIVHMRWGINYRIANIEKFFKNIYAQDVAPGQVYADVLTPSLAPLLRDVMDDAVVAAMVHHTIDEALMSNDAVRRHVAQLAQQKLDDIDSGILLTSVQLEEVRWPRQVDDAFQSYISAMQTLSQAVSDAGTYKNKTLEETAGPVADALYRALTADKPDPRQIEVLWSQVTGQVKDIIQRSEADRMVLVASAKASADYLLSILPEYRKYPALLLQRLYFDAVEQVFNNAEEKWVLQPSEKFGEREVWLQLNKDPNIKPKKGAAKP